MELLTQLEIIVRLRILLTSSPVAQLVEQVTVNHWVGGSNPSRGAIFLFYTDAMLSVHIRRIDFKNYYLKMLLI